MKLAYFNQESADIDDHVLRRMIGEGHVPASCLLGGSLIEDSVKAKRDPCETCQCPKREICGGRPHEAKSDVEEMASMDNARHLVNDAAGARRVLRRGFVVKLEQMIAQAMKERRT